MPSKLFYSLYLLTAFTKQALRRSVVYFKTIERSKRNKQGTYARNAVPLY